MQESYEKTRRQINQAYSLGYAVGVKVGKSEGLKKGLAAGGIAGLLVGLGIALVPTAKADDSYSTITFIKWGGPSQCVWVTSPTYGNYWQTTTDYVCAEDRSVVVTTPVLSGQYVGAQPFITEGVSWVGCSVVMNRQLAYADYAKSGERSSVSCLREMG